MKQSKKTQQLSTDTSRKKSSLFSKISGGSLKTLWYTILGIFGIAIIVLGVGFSIYFMVSVRQMNRELENLRSTMQSMQTIFSNIERDMNTVQTLLSIPTTSYKEEPGGETSEETFSQGFTQLFSAIDEIVTIVDTGKSLLSFEAITNTVEFEELLIRYGLEGRFTHTGAYALNDGEIDILSILFLEENMARLNPFFSYLEPTEVTLSEGTFISAVDGLVLNQIQSRTRLNRVNNIILDHFQELRTQELLRRENTRLGASATTTTGFIIPLVKLNEEVAHIDISVSDTSIRFLGETYTTPSLFLREIDRLLEDGIPSYKEQEFLTLQMALFKMTQDEGFRSYLAEHYLMMAEAFRTDAEFSYLDIFSTDGRRLYGSISINMYSNRIWLHDSDGIPLREIVLSELYSSAFVREEDDTTVVLLAGSHENLTDTIILAYYRDDGIHLFSIPRDIYYQNKKLNEYYRDSGSIGFQNVVESIIGLKIDHVVIVDMYAFIELVNVLGGVTVTFDEALIDPSYRVKNGNVWTTLYYPQGTHHLTGIEALRVVRSRHTTSDFGRSERQRLILDAMQTQMDGFGMSEVFQNSDAIIRMLSLVKTDINVVEAMGMIRRYAQVPILGITILSTSNVLYTTYTSYLAAENEKETQEVIESLEEYRNTTLRANNALIAESKQIETDVGLLATATTKENVALNRFSEPPESLGLWILLPKNNDWSIIRSFVRSEIERIGI